MARRLIVDIVGDSSSLERALSRSGSASSGFGSKLASLMKVAALAAGAAGVGGLALVLDKSVKAALGAETSEARLAQALKNSGLSAAGSAKQIDVAEAASRKLGFTDNEVRDSLGSLLTATGSVKRSIAELATAQDVARFKSVDLSDATKMLTMAQTGSQRAAKQLGITVIPLTTHYDALNRTTEDLTTVTGRLDAAHAKLLDKMATGQAVIDAVNEKVRGQGQAFADTAAGGMAQFHAQLEHLEVTIGEKVLPALVSVVGWVNDHWPQISAVVTSVMSGVSTAWNSYGKPAFDAIVAFSERIVDYVRVHWPEISAYVSKVMSDVHAVISGVVTVVEAVWAKFGNTISEVASIAFNLVVHLVRDNLAIVGSIFTGIGDLIHGRWGKLWDDIKNIASHALDLVVTIVKSAGEILYKVALAAGSAIINGIKSGIESGAQSLYAKASGLVSGVKNKLEFWKSPPDAYGFWLGQLLVSGLAKGLSTNVTPAMNAAADLVSHVKLAISGAFSGMDHMVSAVLNDQLRAALKLSGPQIVSLIGDVKQYAISSLLSDATAYASQQAAASANAQTISDYQAAILSTTGAASGIAVGAYNSAGALARAGIGTGGALDSFAAGGLVPGAVGQPRLAVVHGGETVIPVGGGGLGSATIQINVTGTLDLTNPAAARQAGIALADGVRLGLTAMERGGHPGVSILPAGQQ
jgi:hypothetical protein